MTAPVMRTRMAIRAAAREAMALNRQIRRIAKRYVALVRDAGVKPPTIAGVSLMLATVHFHTPIQLDRLEGFDDFNLVHDVAGLWRHAREDGSIGDCFEPRCGFAPKEGM